MHVNTWAAACKKDKEKIKCRERAQLHALWHLSAGFWIKSACIHTYIHACIHTCCWLPSEGGACVCMRLSVHPLYARSRFWTLSCQNFGSSVARAHVSRCVLVWNPCIQCFWWKDWENYCKHPPYMCVYSHSDLTHLLQRPLGSRGQACQLRPAEAEFVMAEQGAAVLWRRSVFSCILSVNRQEL